MDKKLRVGDILTENEIFRLARRLFDQAQESQEALGARIGRDQAQVSRALSGEKRYIRTCVEIIEAYDYEIVFPLGQVKSAPQKK